ncbi:MAG: aminotransferase class IV [Bacteroidia bacterium]|nr:aminotransferase class IV [Bacteroidia bacterium]
MCQFIETICYEGGRFQRIGLHNERCNRTRNHFFGLRPNLQLELYLTVPAHLKNEIVKCNITYGVEIISITYDLYKIRPVNSLQIVTDNEIDYSFKYADRTKLNALHKLRGQSDDILIVKNGFVTDTSYANIIFSKDEKWYSPQNPLLRGTRLESYLSEGIVTPALLHPEDLHLFSEARIINAMISIENSPVLLIGNINI